MSKLKIYIVHHLLPSHSFTKYIATDIFLLRNTKHVTICHVMKQKSHSTGVYEQL